MSFVNVYVIEYYTEPVDRLFTFPEFQKIYLESKLQKKRRGKGTEVRAGKDLARQHRGSRLWRKKAWTNSQNMTGTLNKGAALLKAQQEGSRKENEGVDGNQQNLLK